MVECNLFSIENGRPATSTKEEKEQEKSVIADANNDNSRHWLTFPNPKTPQYLIDIKQRLGHIKVPFVRPSSTTSQNPVEQAEIPKKPATASDADQRHFLDFNLPQTPDDLRAARHRIAKYRYNPALDNYPTRPQTCPVNANENEQVLPSNEPTEGKDDAETNGDENKPIDQESSTVVVQLIDGEGTPDEYFQAVETANTAQEEYYKNLKLNSDKRSDSATFRCPSTPIENQKDSFVYCTNYSN